MHTKKTHPTLAPDSFGLGLRAAHYDTILKEQPQLDWFEIIIENFMHAHEGYWEFLSDLQQRYHFIMHGVGLSIGSTDTLNQDYLRHLKHLMDFLKPAYVSDHLCFTGLGGHNTHDLLPLPYTPAMLGHVSDRIKTVQDFLGRQLVLENPSSYLEFAESTMSECDFIAALAEHSGCGLLLDVNNIYVSGFNHSFDPKSYIAALPAASVRYIHLAGHRHCGTHIIDTHDDHVVDSVWQLYAHTIETIGPRPTMIEWDENIPPFATVLAELTHAQTISRSTEQNALR